MSFTYLLTARGPFPPPPLFQQRPADTESSIPPRRPGDAPLHHQSHRYSRDCDDDTHTLSTAFRHLPPNSARFGYATEGALFISAQLSTDAVSALRKLRVLTWCRSNLAPKHARIHEAHPPRVKKFCLDSNDFGFIWAGVATWSVIKQTSDIIRVVCNKLTTVLTPTKNCSLADSCLA